MKNHRFEKLGLKINWSTIIGYAVLIFVVLIIVFPITIVFFSSFKTDDEYINTLATQLPKSFLNFKNYITAFTGANLLRAFLNSFILVAVGASGSVVIGSMLSYVLSRFDFPVKGLIKGVYMLTAMIPGVTLQVSIYGIIKSLGLMGTMYAPILLYLGTDLLQVWIYLQYMDTIPESMDESAMLDGASYFRIFVSIIFPMLGPATATVFILKAITIYNDMFIQYLYMSGDKLRTISTALQIFTGQNANMQNLMSAAIIMAMVPTLILYLVLQKFIFRGITSGSVKG